LTDPALHGHNLTYFQGKTGTIIDEQWLEKVIRLLRNATTGT